MRALFPGRVWIAFFALTLLLAPNYNLAQVPGLRPFLAAEQASPGHINDILKSSDGFLWIATQDGLFRFDGYTLLPYRPNANDSTSLPNAFIWSLLEDQKQQLWMGTYGGGIAKYDPITATFAQYRLPGEEPKTQSVRTLSNGPKGQIWLGTEEGLWQFSEPAGTFSPVAIDSTITLSIINCLFWLDTDHLLVGAQEGAYIYQPSQNRWREVSVGGRGIGAVSEFDGHLWLGSYSGLLKCEYSSSEHQIRIVDEVTIAPTAAGNTLSSAVKSMLIDEQGTIWLGTLNGLFTYALRDSEQTPRQATAVSSEQSSDNQINSILQLEPGLVAVGTRQGLWQIQNGPKIFHHLSPSQIGLSGCSDVVLGCVEDPSENWWLGTQQGLSRVSPNYTDKNILPTSFEATCFTPEQNAGMPDAYVINNRWFADEHWVTFWRGGLRNLQPTTENNWQFESISGLRELTQNAGIHDILLDHEGYYWIATPNRGLIRWNRQQDSLQVFEPGNGSGLLSPYIFHLLQDQQQRLWAGTANGGLCYKAPGIDTFTCLTQQEDQAYSISNNLVLSTFEDHQGTIWACTAGGLNRWLGEDRFERFTTQDGLPSDIIYGMLQDPKTNDYWLSTNNGLVRMRKDGSGWVFQTFQASDGLQANEFNQYAFFRTKRGLLCFGGPEGLTYFDPQQVGPYTYTAPVVITDFQLFNISQSVGALLDATINESSEIELSHDQNFLAFEYASPTFTQRLENTYAYQMEGVDADWVLAGTRRYASYPQLPPGAYQFRVKAANHDGVWSDQIRTIDIIIHPPWWQQWWAYALYLIAFLGIIGILFQARLRALRRVDQVRHDERERFRKKTARDFHDEAGNRITKMSLLTEVVKRQTADHNAVQPMLMQLEHSIQDLRLGMRDFIWVLDPKHDNLYDTLLRIKVFGQGLFEHSTSQFVFPELPDSWQRIPLNSPTRRHLLLVAKEALHNCLKHAAASKVTVALHSNSKELEISICDNGKGWSVNEQTTSGNGLRNMQERARQMNATLSIESKPGAGACLKLRLRIPQMED